jgi:hypothetical protein
MESAHSEFPTLEIVIPTGIAGIQKPNGMLIELLG